MADCKGSTFLCLFSNIVFKKKKQSLRTTLSLASFESAYYYLPCHRHYHFFVFFFPMHVIAGHSYSSHSSSSQHCQSKEAPFANRAEFLTSSWPLQTRQHQVEWNPPLWSRFAPLSSQHFLTGGFLGTRGRSWKVHAVAWNPKVMCFINSPERQLKLEDLEGEPNDRNVLERAK